MVVRVVVVRPVVQVVPRRVEPPALVGLARVAQRALHAHARVAHRCQRAAGITLNTSITVLSGRHYLILICLLGISLNEWYARCEVCRSKNLLISGITRHIVTESLGKMLKLNSNLDHSHSIISTEHCIIFLLIMLEW